MNVSDFTPKTFWEKPEGAAGRWVLAILGILFGGWLIIGGASFLLPILVGIFDNLLHLAITGGILAGLGYLVWSPRWRGVGVAMFQSMCRAIASVFVAVDPIGIMREYVRGLKVRLKDVRMNIDRLRGAIQEIQNMVDGNTNQITQKFRLVQTAKSQKAAGRYDKEAKLAANDIGRLQDSNKDLQDTLSKLKGMYDRLIRIEDAADYFVRDSESEIEIRIKKLEGIRRGYNAIKSAMKLIKPDDDQMYLFNLANEQTAHEMAMKVGEIERAMEVSEKVLNGMDLKNMQFEADGLEAISSWEKEDSILLNERQLKMSQGPDSKVFVSLEPKKEGEEQVQQPATTDFGKYLNK